MNSYEYMVTYDHASFYTIAAIMCGCKVIILNPNGNSYEALESANTGTDILLPLEFRLNFPIFMFGVAYGWDDIQWANDTIDLVPPYIEKFKEYENIVKTLRIRINKSEAENKMLSKENVKLNDEISTDVASKNLVNFVLKRKATVREKKIQDLSNEISNQKAEIQILSNIISSIRNLLHQATFRTYSKKVEN